MNDYSKIGADIGSLVGQKQEAYGDAFGRSHLVLEALYPNGIQVEQYAELLTIVRVVDKLFRIATDNDPSGESPWGDICGYALLSLKRQQDDEMLYQAFHKLMEASVEEHMCEDSPEANGIKEGSNQKVEKSSSHVNNGSSASMINGLTMMAAALNAR
jgi:hypothetical protein